MMWWRATAAYIVFVLVLRSEFARVVLIQVSAYWSTSCRVSRAGSSFFRLARTSSAFWRVSLAVFPVTVARLRTPSASVWRIRICQRPSLR